MTPGLFFDDYNCGENAEPSNVSLYTEFYNLENTSAVILNYDVAFQEEGNQTLKVEVFDGAIWQEVALYEEGLSPNIQTESIDVSNYANANFQIRWSYDDNGGERGWHAGINNFYLDFTLNTIDSFFKNTVVYPNPVNTFLNIESQNTIKMYVFLI